MKCEMCQEETSMIHFYRDPKATDITDRFKMCDRCYHEQKAADRSVTSTSLALVPNSIGTALSATSASTEEASSIPTVSMIVKPKTYACRGCYKQIDQENSLCDICATFYESIHYWAENYQEGTQIWNEDHSWYVDVDVLRQYCTAPEEWFHNLPNGVHHSFTQGKRDGNYTFFDNNSDILFVGHLDKSSGSMDREIFAFFEGDQTQRHFAYNGNLDDRLGVFIGHHLLPTQFGIVCDVLLTTNEESGGSTAEEFQDDWKALPDEERKKYRWIIEFDRHAKAPVMYQFEDADLKKRIEEFITTDQGTFSDICLLDEMGCKAINWGTGYHNEHTRNHHVVIEETIEVVEAFVEFHAKYKDTHLPHTYSPRVQAAYRYGVRSFWEEQDWDNWSDGRGWTEQVCDSCGNKVYNRWRIVDGQGEAQMVCVACRSASIRSAFASEPILECEECDKRCVAVHIHNKQELCYNCYVKRIKPSAIEDAIELLHREAQEKFQEETCDECTKRLSSWFEVDGWILCDECYNETYNSV